jgi:amino acid transporter
METSTAAACAVPRLRRTLTLWDLIFYGIVLIQPIAPVPLYGVAQKLSDGHFVTIILIALFAMLITAVSYGRMGALYPTAGSAYTYVGKGLNPHLGFLAGWAMILDYLLQPLINTVWISTALHERYLHSGSIRRMGFVDCRRHDGSESDWGQSLSKREQSVARDHDRGGCCVYRAGSEIFVWRPRMGGAVFLAAAV